MGIYLRKARRFHKIALPNKQRWLSHIIEKGDQPFFKTSKILDLSIVWGGAGLFQHDSEESLLLYIYPISVSILFSYHHHDSIRFLAIHNKHSPASFCSLFYPCPSHPLSPPIPSDPLSIAFQSSPSRSYAFSLFSEILPISGTRRSFPIIAVTASLFK